MSIFLQGTILDNDELAEFAALGSYCEYDLFGIETSMYTHDLKVDMPSDAQRVEKIKFLIDQGYEDKIVIAHDVHTKHRLVSGFDKLKSKSKRVKKVNEQKAQTGILNFPIVFLCKWNDCLCTKQYSK